MTINNPRHPYHRGVRIFHPHVHTETPSAADNGRSLSTNNHPNSRRIADPRISEKSGLVEGAKGSTINFTRRNRLIAKA